ncbi:hypothetical protein V0288_11005 [Pannus brasiliensis CCIBt3594]|uniref:Uncharacterized protein n=1 Tax=Pannus brasiliensis CCIBt3594 TaxID=1427578 RepID=A0AAW9QVX7_9CHRO
MNTDSNLQKVQEPIDTAPEETREIILRVLKLEKDKLYQRNPRNINDDVLSIVKEVIR